MRACLLRGLWVCREVCVVCCCLAGRSIRRMSGMWSWRVVLGGCMRIGLVLGLIVLRWCLCRRAGRH